MNVVEFLLCKRYWAPICLRSNIARPEDIEIFKKTKRVHLESNVCDGSPTDKLLREAVQAIAPEWWGDETKIVVNRNVQCARHVDGNEGHSWVMWFGDFTGGELVFDNGDVLTEKRVWHKIDGRIAHWNTPHEGTKYSVILYRIKPRVSKRDAIASHTRRG